jgi:hypothetical protein
MPREQWQFVIQGMHRGYIDWDRFEAIQQKLADNARAYGLQRQSGPVREGPALLQGRVLCGLCGRRMRERYGREHGRTVPSTSVGQTASAAAPLCVRLFPARSSILRSARCSSS